MRTARPGKSKKLDQAHRSCWDHGWVPSAGLKAQGSLCSPFIADGGDQTIPAVPGPSRSTLFPGSSIPSAKPGGKEFKEPPKSLGVGNEGRSPSGAPTLG